MDGFPSKFPTLYSKEIVWVIIADGKENFTSILQAMESHEFPMTNKIV